MYNYVKGQGWVLGPKVFASYRAYHEGKAYQVTILETPLTGPGRAIYADDAKAGDLPKWWAEWEGIPAGFGAGTEDSPYGYWPVLTEEIPCLLT